MRTLALGLFATTLLGLLGCEDQPCARYVDYVCACHPDDPELDCDELANAVLGGGPEVQNQCFLELRDLQEADDAAGLACDID
jgi:hypothetical protein